MDVPDIHPGGAAATRLLIDALELEPGQRVLEVGCGTGKTVSRLASLSDVSVVGIDSMSEMLNAAINRLRETDGNGTLVCADACSLPFRDQQFDRVYSESVIAIHATSDIKSILAEIHRVSRVGAKVVLNESIWMRGTDPNLVDEINARALADFGLRPASAEAWDLGQWLIAIRDAGFVPKSWCLLPPIGFGERLMARLERLRKPLRTAAYDELNRDAEIYRRRLARNQRNASAVEARLFVLVRS